MHDQRLTLRVLAALLRYPDAEFRAALPDLHVALDAERGLPEARLASLKALLQDCATQDPYDVEARFLDTFDRGRATALHLFEHVHGDSRDRGPALVDLKQSYERAGLVFRGDELPDHLAVVLEFCSTQSNEVATDFLGEIEHILSAIYSALVQRESPYACVLAAVLDLAGRRAVAGPVADEPALDDTWAEPAVFDGCANAGQAKPGAPQPIHFVRDAKPHTRVSPSQGASA
jgi:nitrate reductase molybdenum cofactor assembly chaperone NarJ/NarW